MSDEKLDGSSRQTPRRTLIIDDTITSGEEFSRIFAAAGLPLAIRHAQHLQSALFELSSERWELVLCSLAQLSQLRELFPFNPYSHETAVLALTTSCEEQDLLQALALGARNVVTPAQPRLMVARIRRELHDLGLRRDLWRRDSPQAHYRPAENHAAWPDTAAGPADIMDLLTSLFRKQPFIDELLATIGSARRRDGCYGLLYLVLDDFDAISARHDLQTYRHLQRETARILQQLPAEALLMARLDDATFAALLYDQQQAGLIEHVQKLSSTIAQHRFLHDRDDEHITASIGLRLLVAGNERIERPSAVRRLIIEAHYACMFAQLRGGNQAHIFDAEHDQEAIHLYERGWHDRIREALDHDRFQLVFQPIDYLHRESKREDYEILLRMIDSDDSEIMPSRFLCPATHTGLMPEIDRWVIQHAIDTMRHHGIDRARANFFINLSATTLTDDTFLPWLIDRLKEGGIVKNSLIFEISEHDARKYPDATDTLITMLHKVYCCCCIDHFGTHQDSAQLMTQLDADYLKFDKMLINNLKRNPAELQKLQQLIKHAQQHGKRTIAAFVQDAQTLGLLWHSGVDYIQGYFLQPPDSDMHYSFIDKQAP